MELFMVLFLELVHIYWKWMSFYSGKYGYKSPFNSFDISYRSVVVFEKNQMLTIIVTHV